MKKNNYQRVRDALKKKVDEHNEKYGEEEVKELP